MSTSLALVKLSVLSLYLRVFPNTRYIKYSVYMLATLVGVWWLVSVGVGLFGCRPISKGWSLDRAGCVTYTNDWATAMTISVIIINLAIITLPVYEVLRLQIGAWKKVAVVGLFLLGGL